MVPLVHLEALNGVSKLIGAFHHSVIYDVYFSCCSCWTMSRNLQVKDSKGYRAGKGKMRNRRYQMKRGPVVVYERDEGITKAFRNIPGTGLIAVDNTFFALF